MEGGGSHAPNRPRTRQRIQKEPPALQVPDINDDAAERKRVLNVLAQRRYRARKKQSRTAGASPDTFTAVGATCCSGAAPSRSQETGAGAGPGTTIPEMDVDKDPVIELPRSPPTVGNVGGTSLDATDLDSPWMVAALEALTGPMSLTEMLLRSPTLSGGTIGTSTGFSTDASSSIASSSPGLPGLSDDAIDPPMLLFSTPSSPASPAGGSAGTCTGTGAAHDTFSDPDAYLLPLSELTLVRALMRIAHRLGVATTVWDPAALSPFYNRQHPPPPSSPLADLPRTWQPTRLQLSTPHHPALDILPWPDARDRVIQIFSLPEELRPANNAEGTTRSFHELIYDVEDPAEGMRVYGDDPYDPSCWEVGQVLFERWWFLFDRAIVEQSNRWRSLRGAARLRLPESVGAVG